VQQLLPIQELQTSMHFHLERQRQGQSSHVANDPGRQQPRPALRALWGLKAELLAVLQFRNALKSELRKIA